MIMTQIWNAIYPLLDFSIIISILALGEIVKRYWTSRKLRKFTKVLIISILLAIGYITIFKTEPQKVIVSVLVANWLYEFLLKKIISFVKTSIDILKTDLVGGHPDDR